MLDTFSSIQDIQTQTLLLRILHSIFILLACIELFRSSSLLESEKVTGIVWRIAMFFFAFFVFRIIASFADSYTAYSIGWFSNLVNIGFWGIILYKCRRFRVILSHGNNRENRKSLRLSIDEFIAELETAQSNLKRIVK